jgi:membrane protease YdiL (CAAX protease family)
VLPVLFLVPVCGYLAWTLLLNTGFFRAVYGPDLVAAAQMPNPAEVHQAVAALTTRPPAAAAATVAAADLAHRLARQRLGLWSGLLATALCIAGTLLAFHHLGIASPADLGLTTREFGRNALIGLGAGLLLTPAVGGLNWVLVQLFRLLGPTAVQEHNFTLLGQQGLSPTEWALLVLAACVAAPLWEELLFRGILQAWFIGRRHGGLLALAIAALFPLGSLIGRHDQVRAALEQDGTALVTLLSPLLALTALAPVVWIFERRSPPLAGLLGASALFGWAHFSVWPTPLALTLLGLGLGGLLLRTRSLVAPIAAHALFNAAAALLLAFA